MKNELEHSLVNVRKAYRLLFDFQTRILDTVSHIGSVFNFTYEGGWKLFTDESSLRNGWGSLKHSAWNWLQMYYYQFHFEKRLINKTEVEFAVNILADSGWYEASKSGNPDLSETDLSGFKSPEQSQTKLILIAGIGDVWKDYWQDMDFVLESHGTKQDSEKPGIIVYKGYSLEHFKDQSSILNTLKDFQNYCSVYNIPLELLENKFR